MMDLDMWNDKGLAWRMAAGILGLDYEKQQRRELEMTLEAVERCGFQVVKVRTCPAEDAPFTNEIQNAAGKPLDKEEQRRLLKAVETVKGEWAQRRKEAAEARERARKEEEIRRKAEYDAVAAPYREARRLKMLKRFEAEQARKGH